MERKEAWSIIIAALTMALVLYFPKLLGDSASIGIANSLIISMLIIVVAVAVKYQVARIIDAEVEHKTWEWQRFWITQHAKFKNPIPIGVLLPIIISFFSTGKIFFLAFLQYDSKALPAKTVKKYGRRRFSEIMEWDDALIVFYSLVAVLVLACIARFGNFILPAKFFVFLARCSLYYVLCNMIPIGRLDGMKLIMGSKALYIFTLVLLVLAGLAVFF